MRFTDFVARLGVKLTPGQMALARVAFDGEQIVDVDGAHELFGTDVKVSDAARAVLTVVAGARSGKTYLMALRLLHLGLTVDLGHLAPGEDAYGFVVAPQKDLSAQAIRYLKGALLKSPMASIVVGKPSDEELAVARNGRRISFKAIAASAGGIAGRGRSLVGAFLDECAFFRDAEYQINDQEIFNAIEPRVVEGGQILVCSTPWGESGLLWDLYQRNWGAPKRSIVAHASTDRMRRNGPGWKKVSWQIESARERDPDNARREFDAEFMAGAAGTFFDPVAVDAAVRPSEVMHDPVQGARVVCAADFGFKHDSSALAIVQRARGKLMLSRLVELQPKRGAPLKPSEVAKSFAVEMKRYGARLVMADAWHREAMQEHLQNEGITLVPAPEGQGGKTLVYNRAKEALYEGKVVVPPIDRLVRQLKEIVAKPTSGGGMSIQSPRWKRGGHGDLVSAFALAIYQVHGGHHVADDNRKSWGESILESYWQTLDREQKKILKNMRHVSAESLVR